MKAALFDFGGTIDTDGVHWSERFWEYYLRYKIDVPKADFEKAFVQADTEILKNDLSKATFKRILELQVAKQFELLGLLKDGNGQDEFVRACYADTVKVIGEAKRLLEEIKKRYLLALVSNFYGNLNVVCREFGLDEVFKVRIDSEIVGVHKPDPRIFGIALERLSVRPEEAYVVGDSYDRDIAPGKQLGCRTIWIKGKSWKEESRTIAADHIIGKFEELRSILLS